MTGRKTQAGDADMPRTSVPLVIPDTSAFVRALGDTLRLRHMTKPLPAGHVELLNIVARAAGFRNFQALKAQAQEARPIDRVRPTRPEPLDPGPLSDHARKALQLFDQQGVLTRWPVKYSVQSMAVWALWAQFDAKRSYSESEVNAVLKQAHGFGDHATLRRELINHRLMSRTSDCRDYRKLPARPDEATRQFLAAWRAKSRTRA
jgi:hypothetical protein